MKPFSISKELRLPVSAEVMWDLISNTEHLNRMIGLPAVNYSVPQESPIGTFRWAEGNMPPLGLLRWQEFPFEWVKPEGYKVRRVFEKGPFLEFNGVVDVISTDDDCSIVRVGTTIIPRNIFGKILVSTVANKGVNDTLAYCKKALSEEQGKQVLELPTPPAVQVDKVHLQQAQARLKQIAPVSSKEIQRLIYLIVTSADDEVLGMRPFALADRWRLGRRDLLRLFLYATRAGLLDLEWKLKCPFCRVSKVGYSSLAALKPVYHCDFCGIDYTADLDLATELVFNVNSSIRKTQHQIFCIGSPVNSPHVLCQQVLAPGETRMKSICVIPGHGDYRLRILKKNISLKLSCSESAPNTTVMKCSFDGEEWTADANYFSPTRLELTMENTSSETVIMVFEDISPDSQAVSAAFVTVLPEFRNHFNSEVLSVGHDLSVRRICVLFTDLKGSSALYEQIGDASALGRVYKHFTFLTEIVERNNGSVVKVMGDAVMAVFYYSSDALLCALQIQSEMGPFNKAEGFDPPLMIKVALHAGSAFVVNANDHLDYFGRTINKAARLVNFSDGDDIICSEEVLREPGLEKLWPQFPVVGEEMSVMLKGFPGATVAYRLRFKTAKSEQAIAV